ncbi:hypothetical protein HK097_005588 [Rhizophlyctis rosea]|uniref:Sugar transporter SWEET1 n=1 Tax=Rhizophlyctis rosea TaxID=64517 RepID=A0AAD5X351_9FUNG|nr:hypothetical protein HK097_005588 [Rhizophlyctis rosea]
MNCDSTTCRIALTYVVPAIGACTSFGMGVAPLFTVRKIHNAKNLGKFNPLPFVLTAANATTWMLYALMVHDYFIYIPQFFTILLGTYYTLRTISYASEEMKSRMIMAWVALAGFIHIGGLLSFVVIPDHVNNGAAVGKTVLGVFSTIVLLSLYASPLSTLYRVVVERNAASIALPLAFTSLVNGALWFVYGLAIMDHFVWVPNGAGAILAVVQLVLRFIFKARPVSDIDSISTSSTAVGSEGRLTPPLEDDQKKPEDMV